MHYFPNTFVDVALINYILKLVIDKFVIVPQKSPNEPDLFVDAV
jgi:hypothetical protein